MRKSSGASSGPGAGSCAGSMEVGRFRLVCYSFVSASIAHSAKRESHLNFPPCHQCVNYTLCAEGLPSALYYEMLVYLNKVNVTVRAAQFRRLIAQERLLRSRYLMRPVRTTLPDFV